MVALRPKPLTIATSENSHPELRDDRLLTTREVADFFGISKESVLRRWRAGELPGFALAPNLLRFRASEVEAWLQGQRGEDKPRRVA